MLTAKSVFREILDDDEAFRLFCSIAASGEAQGGWENGRIAALLPDSLDYLAPRVARHGADEDKHGRIFSALLHKRGLTPVPVPPEADYTMILERQGIGLSHRKLTADAPLDEHDVVAYLAHSRVTEQRASEQMRLLVRYFGDDQGIGKAVKMICRDEDNHLAYCHEELLRLAAAGHGREIKDLLDASAAAEIRVYRDVSLAVMGRMAEILRWPKAKTAAITAGIHGMYAWERAGGWFRMVSLRMPERRGALDGPAPAPAAPEFA
ncbi:ferritin-like domain-containing protein [Streptacidiphilus pinicola]|uniref:Ferritin-like domain-containing protein n=1 Tax=Streptacidiphilus pinicola TaxID=2219663 RepID=A0A2X0K7F1_9ACTN|nr:ferritin-like domain-containing protein [Streptacidiphilus pinicola]RAG83150.1 ferritin-like domain-containing protein [Streptacidiphilus pinicola]